MKRRSPHVNNILNKIENSLRNARRPMYISDIERATNLALAQRKDLMDIIKDNPKIHFDELTEKFSLKKIYPYITNKETLLEFMRRSYKGLPQNQDLYDSYTGIEQDIQELSEAGYIRSIYNSDKDKRFNVLFYKNPHDTAQNRVKPVDDSILNLWRSIRQADQNSRKKVIEVYKRRKLI